MSHRHLFVGAASGLVIAVVIAVAPVRGAGWNPQLAAKYLDDRQRDWFAWPQAQSTNGPCVSCHTGMPYLLARPALRRLLKETQPTMYETGLLNRLRANAGAKPAGALQSVETIFAAMLLPQGDAAQRPTFDQLWALQKKDGALQGGWLWLRGEPRAVGDAAAIRVRRVPRRPRHRIRAGQSPQRGAGRRARELSAERRRQPSAACAARDAVGLDEAAVDHGSAARQAIIDEILKKQQSRRRLDARVARPVDRTSRSAGVADGRRERQLRHGVHGVCSETGTRGSGLGARESWLGAVIDQSGARLAEGASGSADRRVARRLDEQEISRRIDAGEVPAGRGHRIRRGHISEPVDDVDRRDPGNSTCSRIRKLITGSECC